jgi:hypothetical protein
MEWRKQGSTYLGSECVEIRSVRVVDEQGQSRRFRVSTVREDSSRFTSVPAEGRLYKSDKGHIGVMISGRNMGYVKVGKNLTVQQSVVVGINAVSRKPLKELLKGTDIEVVEIDGAMVGIER